VAVTEAIFTKRAIISKQCVDIFYTAFCPNQSRNVRNMDKIIFTPCRLIDSADSHETPSCVTTACNVGNAYTEFHKHPASVIVADARSQGRIRADGRACCPFTA